MGGRRNSGAQSVITGINAGFAQTLQPKLHLLVDVAAITPAVLAGIAVAGVKTRVRRRKVCPNFGAKLQL